MELNLKFSPSAPAKECLPKEFLQGMLDRRGTSFHKYGSAFGKKNDFIKNLEDRLKLFKETGNGEYLIDIAVFACLEFMNPGFHLINRIFKLGTDEVVSYHVNTKVESQGVYVKGEEGKTQRHHGREQ